MSEVLDQSIQASQLMTAALEPLESARALLAKAQQSTRGDPFVRSKADGWISDIKELERSVKRARDALEAAIESASFTGLA